MEPIPIVQLKNFLRRHWYPTALVIIGACYLLAYFEIRGEVAAAWAQAILSAAAIYVSAFTTFTVMHEERRNTAIQQESERRYILLDQLAMLREAFNELQRCLNKILEIAENPDPKTWLTQTQAMKRLFLIPQATVDPINWTTIDSRIRVAATMLKSATQLVGTVAESFGTISPLDTSRVQSIVEQMKVSTVLASLQQVLDLLDERYSQE